MDTKLKFKNFLKHFFLIDDTPHKIASGAALGVFLGIVPGEGVLATIFFATIFRLNRLSATAGVLAVNMWATVLVLPLAAAVGGFFFRTDAASLIANFNATYHLGWSYFLTKIIIFQLVLPLVVGFIVSAGLIALLFYFLLYYLLKYHKLRFK